MIIRVLLLLALVLGCGCKKSDEGEKVEPYDGPPPVGAAEKKRGVAACEDYRAKVCKCAATDKSLQKDCQLAPSRISALELSMRMAATENASNDDRAAAISNARKVMQKCIERAAELATGCPTPAAPEADEPGVAR